MGETYQKIKNHIGLILQDTQNIIALDAPPDVIINELSILECKLKGVVEHLKVMSKAYEIDKIYAEYEENGKIEIDKEYKIERTETGIAIIQEVSGERKWTGKIVGVSPSGSETIVEIDRKLRAKFAFTPKLFEITTWTCKSISYLDINS